MKFHHVFDMVAVPSFLVVFGKEKRLAFAGLLVESDVATHKGDVVTVIANGLPQVVLVAEQVVDQVAEQVVACAVSVLAIVFVDVLAAVLLDVFVVAGQTDLETTTGSAV
jgi:hypothetical protein